MKLKFDDSSRNQPDPFIFEDNGKFYLYVTCNRDGVEAYSADDIFGEWKYEGVVASVDGWRDYWAPSIIKHKDKYYIYVSTAKKDCFQYLHVLSADSPLGPFSNAKCLYNYFSIDSHVVETDAGLFLFYAKDKTYGYRIGTRVYVDRLLDPYTPAYNPKEIIVPTFDEEKFTPKCQNGGMWHTVEGAFWFQEGDWQYVMYSAGCFEDDTYHIGYAAANTNETDLTLVDFIKHTNGDQFAPVIIKNDFEEGTGHHSVIKYKGEYYAIYHARDYGAIDSGYREARTARICKLKVDNGIITAEQYPDRV